MGDGTWDHWQAVLGSVLGQPRQTDEALHVQVATIVGRVHRDVLRASPHEEVRDRRRRHTESRLGYEAEHLPSRLPEPPVVLDTGPLEDRPTACLLHAPDVLDLFVGLRPPGCGPHPG
jgi:hypothetical protein